MNRPAAVDALESTDRAARPPRCPVMPNEKPERCANSLGRGDSPSGGPLMHKGICLVADCGREVRAISLCERHYKRNQRHGDPLGGRVQRAGRTPDANGYIVIHRPEHPLASPQGKVLEHRVVLYDKIGPGKHPCHWCGKTLDWAAHRHAPDALTTDHLDTHTDNNDVSNLVPACLPCNSGRARRKAA